LIQKNFRESSVRGKEVCINKFTISAGEPAGGGSEMGGIKKTQEYEGKKIQEKLSTEVRLEV